MGDVTYCVPLKSQYIRIATCTDALALQYFAFAGKVNSGGETIHTKQRKRCSAPLQGKVSPVLWRNFTRTLDDGASFFV